MRNTRCPVRFENKREELRHEIVEFSALHRVGKPGTVCTGDIVVLCTTGAYFAPCCFLVEAASFTFSLLEHTAGAAI